MTITAPSGVTPAVTVSGPAGYHQSLTATQTLTGLAVGRYTVSARGVTVTNPIVATVYACTSTGSPAAVAAGATAAASVSYAAQPGSGALWVAKPKTVLAYTATQLAGSTSAAPAAALGTCPCTNNGVAIDASGNLWVSGSNSASTVVEYTASELATSGSPTPAVTLSDNGAGSLKGPQGLAFDRSGTLWVMNRGNNTVVAYSPTQLATSGSPTPAVTLTDDGSGSIVNPLGVALDGGGNLWVANAGLANTVVEFTGSQLVSSGKPTPAVTLTSTVGGLSSPTGLAFDAGGNLWVSNYSAGTVIAFAASQLVASGAPTANVTVSGSSLTGPGGLAFDPPPANLPLK